MAIFSPTIYYFGQPVQAAAGGGYIIRTDANASSVSLALPGTQFGSTFGQTSFRDDISGYINGGSSLLTPPVTGSPVFASSSVNFASDGYTTSIAKGSGNISPYSFPGSATNVNFGTGAFTIEGWFNPANATNGDTPLYFAYSPAHSGFCQWSSAGYYRWVGQNGAGNEALRDYSTTTPAAGTWVHLFMARDGSTWYGGVAGTIRANFTFTNSGNATGTGGSFNAMSWPGNTGQRAVAWQDIRITKGVARYTGSVGATYTVPQSIVTTS